MCRCGKSHEDATNGKARSNEETRGDNTIQEIASVIQNIIPKTK